MTTDEGRSQPRVEHLTAAIHDRVVVLSWTPVSEVTRVFRGRDLLAALSPGQFSFTDEGLRPGLTGQYKVAVRDQANGIDIGPTVHIVMPDGARRSQGCDDVCVRLGCSDDCGEPTTDASDQP